jgi:hypothetical protein
MLRIYADFEKGKTKCSEKSRVEKLKYVGLCKIFALKAFFYLQLLKIFCYQSFFIFLNQHDIRLFLNINILITKFPL